MSLSSEPLRPRLALRFGITGHRPPRLSPDHHGAARAACAEIFAEAKEALRAIHRQHAELFAEAEPLVRLVSALASGADTVAAQAALGEGIALSTCLPFPASVYSRDFSSSDWTIAENLARKADGSLAITDYAPGDEAAYEAVGRLVLAQSDILIAIWDGAPARGRGGTTDVVAEAIGRHIPVIHINPDGSHEPILLWSGLHDEIPDRPSVDGVSRVPLKQALPSLINALCAPPEGSAEASLREFLNGQRGKWRAGLAWPLLLLASSARTWSKTQFRAPDAEEAGRYFAPLVEPFARLGHFGERLTGSLVARFAQADAAASAAALQFRSSFVTNYSLAALAVLLALSGILWPAAKAWLITAELLVIALIIANTRRGVKSNFHQLWIDRRHLAERLRLLGLSAMLGRLALRDVEDGTTEPGWVTWYARACARELELPPCDFDAAYLGKVRASALKLIDDQIAYHAANAHVMEHTHHRLHRAGDLLFMGTIVFCLIYLVAKFMAPEPVVIAGASLTAIVTIATAFFPALAAALYGIRMQGDFAANGERSRVIAARLKKLRASLALDELSYTRMVDRLRRLNEIMLSEIHQWQQQYETRPLTLPG
ncbi:hypothetical protein [Aurantiacibacter poecillastricola]|uniref:hypothetical protein n=1 Tax=Aurantiacibacter poecillastricola TaxID=3064385 RepID=UPI00273FDBDA|nr:hypothetical protein [Aurantiacibacter sp. 219JJ12-13]MDP5262411.1 hypothetical protein [Aurantiacibacter sp. 219JJ12-13]